MKCVNCGNEVIVGQRFCANCGTEQNIEAEQNLDEYEYLNQEQNQVNSAEDIKEESNKNDTVLTIFSIVCAIFYGINSIDKVLNFIGTLFHGGLFQLRTIFSMVFTLLDVTPRIWMCLILICIAKKRTSENSDGLLLCLGSGGVVLAVEQLIQVFINTMLYYGDFAIHFGKFSTEVLGILVTVGGVYGILRFYMGENPIVGKSKEENLTEMKNVVFIIKSIIDDIIICYQEPSRLKTNRSLWVYILLNIVTCGIYSLYFINALVKDMNVACGGDGRKTAGLIKLILLSIITCGIYNWIWYYNLGDRLASNAPRYGMNFQENGTTILLWKLLGVFLFGIGPFIAMHIIIKNTNMLCKAYNHQNNM